MTRRARFLTVSAMVAISIVVLVRPHLGEGVGATVQRKIEHTQQPRPGRTVNGLDPELAERFRRAKAAAAAAGVTIELTSGWRSAARQQQLFERAVARHGSPTEAARWVLPPADSAHVKGLAVDIGPARAMRWLDRHGAEFGLCRRYANEPWHFEPLTRPGGECPPLEPHAVASSLGSG